MPTATRSLFCWIALGFISAVVAVAYPIPPKPLWPLTAEADLIVVAEVKAVEKLPRDDDDWNTGLARLQVLETLKGPRLKDVDVPFEADLICPTPPRYALAETVIAFLKRKEGRWQTVSLSYGTLYPRGDDLKDVTAMVRAAVEIQQASLNDGALDSHRLDWMIQAASLPGTRWHGLYEFQPISGSIWAISDDQNQPTRAILKPSHVELLADALVRAPKFDKTFPMMLRLLRNFEDSRIDELAVRVLEGLLALETLPWWPQPLLWETLTRWGDSDPEARMEQFGKSPWEATGDQLRQIWSEAKIELAIPDIPAVEIEPFGY